MPRIVILSLSSNRVTVPPLQSIPIVESEWIETISDGSGAACALSAWVIHRVSCLTLFYYTRSNTTIGQILHLFALLQMAAFFDLILSSSAAANHFPGVVIGAIFRDSDLSTPCCQCINGHAFPCWGYA